MQQRARLEAVAQRPLPARVGSAPSDESPYGIRDCVGNMREWTRTPFAPVGATEPALTHPDDPSAERVLRGGCWFQSLSASWLAGRFSLAGHHRADILGFRLARRFDG